MTIQVDAAINSGNSGGAIIDKDNKLIGIAMMKLTNTDNIAYIVPSVVINTFLNDIKDCSSRFIRTVCRSDSDSFKVEIF
jgi:S1-C subfamily serine protease